MKSSAVLCFSAVLALSGCALNQVDSTLPVDASAGVHGIARGGQQPVTGSTVLLVATGATGYGSLTTTLASTTTDANGNFTLPAYTCPTPTTPTLLEANGGNPGLAAGTNNQAILLVAVAGPCGQLSASSFFNIDEVTTVAAAYTMRPFATSIRVGTSATNALGLSSAMLTANVLANPATGQSPGANLPSGVAVPVATINALANSISSCVNSTSAASTACTSLFTYTGTQATGANATVFAALTNLATTPTDGSYGYGNNIYNLAPASPPFLPTLSGYPNDWTLDIVYTGGYLNYPQTAIDIDAAGNIWAATSGGLYGTVEEMSPQGVMLQTGLFNGIVDGDAGLAIEPSGNLVVASSTKGDASVIRFTPGGTVLYSNYSSSLGTPKGVAIDLSGNAIVADPGAGTGKVFLISPAGTIMTSVSETDGPQYPGIDASGNIYVTDNSGPLLDRYLGSLSGTHSTFGDCGNFNSAPSSSLSFDSAGNVYEGNYGEVCEYNAGSTTGIASAGVGTGEGAGFRVDGLGNVWAGSASSFTYRLNEFANLLTTRTLTNMIPEPTGYGVSDIAIDRSGNVWLANTAKGGLTEVVGIAAPLTTPISVATSTNMLGQRP